MSPANHNLTLTVRLPSLSVVPSHRDGFKIRGSLGLRSFAAVVRHIPGRLVYTTTEAGERRSKGWAAVDDETDVTQHVAELLMWAATA